MRATLFLLPFLFLSSACAQNSAAPASAQGTSPSRAAAEDDVAEAVFRQQFEHNASALQKGADKYCLALPGDRSPGPEFLARFADVRPPVVAADQCTRKAGSDLFFRINNFNWRGDDEVWVRGGYYEGNLSSSLELFQVVRKDGKWIVKGQRMEAIS